MHNNINERRSINFITSLNNSEYISKHVSRLKYDPTCFIRIQLSKW